MALSPTDAVAQAKILDELAGAERHRLNLIDEYLNDDPDRRLTGLPENVPTDVQRLAKVSRVNFLKFVTNSRVQGMYVDGFRDPKAEQEEPVWRAWQLNRMDARQIGIHRSTIAFGTSYVVVTPGVPVPKIRGVSPLKMTAFYADDDEWPVYALEDRGSGRYRLYDDEFVHELRRKDGGFTHTSLSVHGMRSNGSAVCPVIAYRETVDQEHGPCGVVWPNHVLQDQINITTFGLLVAQHYGAFRQRYVMGWMAESETELLDVSASRLLSFEDSPGDVQVGEFSQTDLNGYLDSREASLRHLATVSQTPAHELLGQLVNLSAEALAAAEASKRRAITENQVSVGESHEQTLALVGEAMGTPVSPNSWVRWRDMEARALSASVDALGKMVQMLGIPPEELWDKVPGATADEVRRWKEALARMTPTLPEVPSADSSEPAQPAA